MTTDLDVLREQLDNADQEMLDTVAEYLSDKGYQIGKVRPRPTDPKDRIDLIERTLLQHTYTEALALTDLAYCVDYFKNQIWPELADQYSDRDY